MLAFTVPQRGSYTAEPLLGGFAGTEQTIQKIRSLFDDAMRSLDVRRLAVDILRSAGAPQYDAWSQISAIYQFVKNHFYFVNDPVGKEVLMPFEDLLALGAGDCDEINAIAMAVLLSSIGYETRLVTIAADAYDPSQFSHIYTEVFVGGNWIPMDAARPGAQMGAAPPSFFIREWWSLTDDSHGPYPGKGQLGLGQYAHMNTRRGLNGYALAGFLGQDDGTGVDLSNLPLAPVGDSSVPLDTLPPASMDSPIGYDSTTGAPIFATSDTGNASMPSGGGSSGILSSITNILSSGAKAVGSGVSAVKSALKPAIGPGGSSSLQTTGGTASIGGVKASSLLMYGALFLGAVLVVRAVVKK